MQDLCVIAFIIRVENFQLIEKVSKPGFGPKISILTVPISTN